MFDRLERRFGKFAVPNLMIYIIGGYVIGYLLAFGQNYTGVPYTAYLTLEPYKIIHNFQIWRLVSWVLLPPIGASGALAPLWAAIMMFLYYQLGSVLERTWGTFKFNLYIFGGIFFTIIGAFILYGLYVIDGMAPFSVGVIGAAFSTYYINLTIFLAFAVCFPDMKVMLYFIIPVKMKYMAILYAAISIMEFLTGGIGNKIVIAASLLNFVIFFFSTGSFKRLNPKEIKRKRQFKKAAQPKTQYGTQNVRGYYGSDRQPTINSGISHHRCSVCGRTEVSNPELEFRFCSRCNGNYEYCSDHLFTHTHVN